MLLGEDVTFRRANYSLSDEQRTLRDTFAALLAKECPPERVRAAEPLGFDPELWQKLLGMRAQALGVPAACGGDDGGLVDLVLVAEQIGHSIAAVPFIEATVAARLLARIGAEAAVCLQAALDGNRLVTLALNPFRAGEAQLIPSGAIADAVIGLVDGRLVLLTTDDQPVHVANHAGAPLAFWSGEDRHATSEVLLVGDAAIAAFETARREWKLLMAAALVGIADAALELAADFAKDRVAFGVPIATFQAVSHPLADCAIAVVGGRRLVWKAAWFADHEPDQERHLIPMAFLHAARTAVKATTVGVHTQGGLGFTLESPMQLFFRRAKGWANQAGDPAAERRLIAEACYGPVRV